MTEKVYMRELTEQEMTEIYQSHLVEDFPAGEVKPLAHMLEGRKKGQYEAYGLFEKDTLKGYAYFIKNSTQPAALLDYFAIVRGLRSAGYGSLFLKKLQAMCIEQQKQLILEVENPDYEMREDKKGTDAPPHCILSEKRHAVKRCDMQFFMTMNTALCMRERIVKIQKCRK
ncbi:MAG: hypothetical protein ACLTH3_04125 [Lachnospira sp.]